MIDFDTQIGLSIEKTSFLATTHGLGPVVGVLVIVPLSDYLGRKKTIIISNCLIAFTLIGIVIVGNSWQMLYLLVGCCALFYGATFPLYGACAGDYFPKNVIATVAGAWTPFCGVGAMAAHWVTGWMRDTIGTFRFAFAIATLMSFFRND
jgi:MFS family permease